MGSDERVKSGATPQQESEELLQEARRLQRSVEATEQAQRRKQKHSTAGQVEQHVTSLHQGTLKAIAGLKWFYGHLLAPLATHRWVRALLRSYRRLWTKVVYTLDSDGDPVLSKSRAAGMIAATLVALWFTPAVLGALLELVWDTAWMATSYRSGEIWYLGKSQELDPEGHVFSAQGCVSVSCTDQTSIYFRIKPSIAHHIWSLVRNHNIFFPEFVAAGIQNDVNKCHVTAYGARWNLLVRNWDIYPQILSVDCIPVTEREIEAIQQSLRAPGGN